MVADPAPRSAFLVGILVFAPGVSFLAAVQVIATARASFDLTLIALIIVVVINVLLVWLPIVLHLVAPHGHDTVSDGLQRLAASTWQSRAHLRACRGGRDHGHQRDLRARGGPMTAHRRIADPVEAMAQRVAERVVDLVLDVVDLNAIVQRVDLNGLMAQVDVNALLARVDVTALLDQVDLNAVLARIDTGALLDRIDINALLSRIDMDALVEQTDLGAVIARSSGGAATEALDAARSEAVGLDQFIDRWVQRALRRKQPAPVAPRALLDGAATPPAAPSHEPPAPPSEAPAGEATK